MGTERKTLVRSPLPAAVQATYVGTIPIVEGAPSWIPAPDQLPLAHDSRRGILYFYTDKWEAFGLAALNEINLVNIANLDNVLRVPVTYVSGDQQVKGYLTLKELRSLLNGE